MADDLPPPPPGYAAGAAPQKLSLDDVQQAYGDLPPPPAGYTIVDPRDLPTKLSLDDVQQSMEADRSGKYHRGIIDDASKGAGFWTNMRASLAPDVNDQIRRFAASRFPGMSVDEAAKRYGVVNGHIVYADENGDFARETPSVFGGKGAADTFTRAGDYAASSVGPFLPGAAGAVAGTAAAESGPGSIAAAGGAAGATDVARQALDRFMAGESMHNIDYWNSAGQSALAAGGQTLGVGASRLFNSNPLGVSAWERTQALDPARIQGTADLEAEARSRGVDLSAGQSTGLRSLQATERQLGRRPETADTIYDFTTNQRQQQVPAAVRAEIGQISPIPPGEGAVGQFRDGAQKVLDDAVTARAVQARQSYSAALGKDSYFDPDAVSPKGTKLSDLMQRPSMQQAWQKAQTLAKEDGATLPEMFTKDAEGNLTLNTKTVPDWRSWDYMKRGLDSVIDDNTNSLGRLNTVGRSVNGTKQELLGILDKANPDYAAARLQYGKASDTVQELLDGGTGMLHRLKDAQPLDRQAIVRRVFDSGSLTAEEVGRMRGQFALAGRKDDWNAGLASWLSDKLDDSIAAAGRTGNTPGQFYSKVWQDPRQQAVIRSALGGDQARIDGIEKLMQVVNASAKGLPEGSPTATDLLATQSDAGKMISRGARIAGRLTSLDTYTDLGNQIVEGWAATKAPQKRIQLAQTLLSPGAADRLRQLSLLSPNSQRAMQLSSQLLTMGGTDASGIRTPADFVPPSVSRDNTR